MCATKSHRHRESRGSSKLKDTPQGLALQHLPGFIKDAIESSGINRGATVDKNEILAYVRDDVPVVRLKVNGLDDGGCVFEETILDTLGVGRYEDSITFEYPLAERGVGIMCWKEERFLVWARGQQTSPGPPTGKRHHRGPSFLQICRESEFYLLLKILLPIIIVLGMAARKCADEDWTYVEGYYSFMFWGVWGLVMHVVSIFI